MHFNLTFVMSNTLMYYTPPELLIACLIPAITVVCIHKQDGKSVDPNQLKRLLSSNFWSDSSYFYMLYVALHSSLK